MQRFLTEGVQSGYRLAGRVVPTFPPGPQENETMDTMRCERLSGTFHQACLGDGCDRLLLSDFSSEAVGLWKPTVVFFFFNVHSVKHKTPDIAAGTLASCATVEIT